MNRKAPAPIIVMGPSGSGKSTLGKALARALDRPFIEGDGHHPPGNIAKLRAGIALSDEDREPFLDSVGCALSASPLPPVASCSALRVAHRDRLRAHVADILFVWLDVPRTVLRKRLAGRPAHFMPASQLSDQLSVFEPPRTWENVVHIDGGLGVPEQVEILLPLLKHRGGAPS
jgi:carbohydrate kinase (thermoresistant glucokinase family)